MAVLSRDEYFNRLMDRVGTDTSDDAIKFIEDFTDTYNSITAGGGSTDDWEKKYKELDEAWRRRYTARFFSGDVFDVPDTEEKKVEITEETIKPEDLFETVTD